MEAIKFQVEPVKQAFHVIGKGHNDYSIHFDLEGENPTITCQIIREDKGSIGNQSVMRLEVNSKGLGHFMIQTHNLPRSMSTSMWMLWNWSIMTFSRPLWMIMSIVTIIMKAIIIMKIWIDLLAFTSLVACINDI